MKAGLTILCYLMLHSSFSQVQLHITVINEHQVITPAMVCITDINSLQTYIPPGILTPEPSYPDTFYTGIAFTHSKNFTGPVRKMKGKGAVNGQRTYVYGNSPTLPYWSEPVIYQTTGDFEINLPKGKYRVSVEHGNEYIPIQEIITLSGNTFH